MHAERFSLIKILFGLSMEEFSGFPFPLKNKKKSFHKEITEKLKLRVISHFKEILLPTSKWLLRNGLIFLLPLGIHAYCCKTS